MQKIKKPVSILLAVLMVFSLFAVVPFTASAVTIDDAQSLRSSMEAKMNDYYAQGDWDRADALKNYYDWLDEELEYADGEVTPELENAYNAAYEYFMAGGSGVSYPDVNNVYRATNGWVNVTVSDLQPGDVLVTSDTLSVRKGDCDIVLVGGTYCEEDNLSRTNPNNVTLGNNISFLFGGNYAHIIDADNAKNYDPVYNNALGNAYMVISNENGTVYLAGYYFTIYTVTWKNGGTTLKTDTVDKDAIPAYDGNTPVKDENEQYSYTFTGWTDSSNTFYSKDSDLPAASKDETYTATYSETLRSYTITWKDGDDQTLKSESVAYGTTPSYTGATPTKTEDDEYTYEFNNTWSPSVASVTGNATYTAQFDAVPKAHVTETSESFATENYQVYDDFLGGTFAVTINGTNVIITPEDNMLCRENWAPDSSENINFSITNGTVIRKIQITSQSSTVGKVIAGEREIIGERNNQVISYDIVNASSATLTGISDVNQITVYYGDPVPASTVTWKNDDGTIIDTTTVANGTTPTHTAPTKAEDENYTYTFAGWTPEITAVTGDATYTAQFTAVPKSAPAKLILNVGENGKVVMDNGTFGNATDASNISDVHAPINVADGAKIFIVDGHSANLVEGGSINIATGGEVSFYPSADNTGKITAIPDEGYICTGWYNGNTRYTTKDTIDYQEISEDMTLTAKFAPDLFPQHSITLGGNIGVNFYINSAAANFASASKATVKFTWDGGGEDRTKEVDLTKLTPNADGYYKATVDVVAAQMAHKIHAEVYLNGEKLEQTDDYSVQDYAETVFVTPEKYDSEKPEQLRALAQALLNYGAMAQTVFYNSLKEHPALANTVVGNNGYEGVTADQIEGAINGEASDLNAIATQLGARYYTNSLIYLSKNTLRIYFTPTSYPGEIPNAGAYNGNLSGYYYYVDHANIPAAELDNQQTFTVGGTTFTFSALDYAKAVVESTKMEPEQQNLAKALYLYNQKANAYFDAAPAPVENEVISSGFIDDFSTLNVGDYIAKGVEYAADIEYKVVLTGGTYGTESRDGIVVRNGDYNFNADEYGMGTYSAHVPQPNVFIEDYNENEKFYPAVDGVEGNAFVVVAKDDTQKIITIAGANVTQN